MRRFSVWPQRRSVCRARAGCMPVTAILFWSSRACCYASLPPLPPLPDVCWTTPRLVALCFQRFACTPGQEAMYDLLETTRFTAVLSLEQWENTPVFQLASLAGWTAPAAPCHPSLGPWRAAPNCKPAARTPSAHNPKTSSVVEG